MPHVNGSSDGDDLGDADEIKVFKHDEECEEEKKLIAEERQSDSLTEDKSSLVTEGESQVYHLFFSFPSTWFILCFPSALSIFTSRESGSLFVLHSPKIRTKGFPFYLSLWRTHHLAAGEK